MNNFKQLRLHLIDKHLRDLRVCDMPSKGWIKTIRSALGMTIGQLAKRLGVSPQAITQLEKNETAESISLKSLKRAAEALDCQLVYAFVPNQGSLENTIKHQDYTMLLAFAKS